MLLVSKIVPIDQTAEYATQNYGTLMTVERTLYGEMFWPVSSSRG